MGGTLVLNEVLKQGIFASEQEMSQMEDTKNSIVNKFGTIDFEEEDANRSKMQAITEYLMDVEVNAKEYFSALNVAGIFSFEEDCPIENWLYNSIDNLKGSTIKLPAKMAFTIFSFDGKNRKGKIKYTNRSFSILGTARF